MFEFPSKEVSRIAIRLKPAAERMVKKGHPWVFDQGITKQNKTGQAGDLAIIFDNKKNKFLACGLYDPASPIRIKILQVHQSATINQEWFDRKIKKAYQIRQPLLETNTNSYRLIYGENDGLPSLIADVYDYVLVVKLYAAIWFPYLQMLLPTLLEVSQCKTIVLRLSRNLEKEGNQMGLQNGQVIHGNLENEVIVFKEHGLNFSANVIQGHKTGYFLDHRHNRLQVGHLAKNKTMLDVFAYAGGFSVHALARGAKSVTSLDISAKALAMAKENGQLNPHQGEHILLPADAFEGLDKLVQQKKNFDIVVIDPPSFAKKEEEVDGALQSYYRLAVLGTKLVKKGGWLILASCTARISSDLFFETVEKALLKSPLQFESTEKTYHDTDHPITFEQGRYLKCGYYRCQ
jgi:23S rRNA (cytosine1962-C5)-methyltransferase